MPSPRKRIGFLPRSEVQKIIDKICEHNKLSQSKVTGILVEEALFTRGILNCSISKLSVNDELVTKNSQIINNDKFTNDTYNNDENLALNDKSMHDDIKMINDYIEYKLFKKIMTKNIKNI